ncbi:hypothetical protein PTSG_11283 [Salpingoeca rosetta]|uniref:Uncharacterized protein n=1 Tax=Salpingoeca rosetta (strain ATCC 50818 / BSB-021) TaxID=946362 RepID=F2USZ0_SALR5|nr:uncharacterized protein PTSG_11283 [Salpingoeca rosetta]EGD81249.1 hypothetical protein PTSG_11283 [Salpingoeca rosetta]|eukprot:XP_004987645.1 hypothetical protein PTSG_11283 [Salpingoeca rosetta]
MMHRRVAFVFEEFFKSLSTQVHTALESARINLFSGDNAWQRALEPAAVTPNHPCCGGMNRRALPCDDHPATLYAAVETAAPTHTTNKRAMSNVSGSWLFAAGEQVATAQVAFSAAAAAEAMHTYRQQDEGNVEDTCHACQLHSPRTCGLACRLLLQLPQFGGRCCAHAVFPCVSKEQLWTHTSMVMVGTSNHSDAVIAQLSPSTAQPPSHPGDTSPDLAVEEAHEAVEPTTMTMTSDEAATATATADAWLQFG